MPGRWASKGTLRQIQGTRGQLWKLHILLLHISISKRPGGHFQASKRMKRRRKYFGSGLTERSNRHARSGRHGYTSSYGWRSSLWPACQGLRPSSPPACKFAAIKAWTSINGSCGTLIRSLCGRSSTAISAITKENETARSQTA